MQAGKAACDRACNIAKMKINDYIDGGKDFLSATDVFRAFVADSAKRPTHGYAVFAGTIKKMGQPSSVTIAGITEYNDFSFPRHSDRDPANYSADTQATLQLGAIRAHRHYGIGTGLSFIKRIISL